MVDFDSGYLVVVAVDYNNHNLIDLVDMQVDFAVVVVVDIEHQHYFFVMMMMMTAVVVIVLAHILLLHRHSILPKKKLQSIKEKQIDNTHFKRFNIIETDNLLRIKTFKHDCTLLTVMHNTHHNSWIILKQQTDKFSFIVLKIKYLFLLHYLHDIEQILDHHFHIQIFVSKLIKI